MVNMFYICDSILINYEMSNEIMNVVECAEMLGKSKDTIRKYISENTIPFYKKNGSIYFLRSEIINWIKDGKQ